MTPLRIGSWTFHPDSLQLRRGTEQQRLSDLERDLLQYLAQRAGQTIPADELLREVWQYAPTVRSRAVTNLVGRLRKKLEPDGEALVSVYGQGYRLDVPDDGDLIGRRTVVREIEALLAAHGQLTLYGLGGVGKTSLARAVADARRAVWVTATGMQERHELLAAMAQSLGLPPARVSRGAIGGILKEVAPELVVVDGADALGPWLYDWIGEWRTSLTLPFLVTTRRSLGREPTLRVDPLGGNDAVALFVRRAREVRPRDALPDDLTHQLAELVSGLPLALEIAAARLRLVELPRLLSDLERDVAALGQRAGSLQAVLDASWQALTALERQVLAVVAWVPRALDVDTLQVASGLDRWAVLDAVDVLVNSALVVDTERTFTVLDVVRRDATTKAPSEATAAFCAWAVRQARQLVADKLTDPAWVPDALVREAATFRRAMALVSTPADRATLLLATYHHRTLYGRPLDILDELDALPVDDLAPAQAVDILHVRASLPAGPSDQGKRVDDARQALTMATDHGSPAQVSACWNRLVFNRMIHEGAPATRDDCAEMLEASRRDDVPVPIARKALILASDVARQLDDLDEALSLAEQALKVSVRTSPIGCHVLTRLALIHQLAGHPTLGLPLAREAYDAAVQRRLPLPVLINGVTYLQCSREAQRNDVVEMLVPPLLRLANELDFKPVLVRVQLALVDIAPERLTVSLPHPSYEKVASAARAIGEREVEAQAWCEAGFLHHREGHLPEALDSYQRAIGVGRSADARSVGGTAMAWAALAHLASGNRVKARAHLDPLQRRAGQVQLLAKLVADALQGGLMRDPPEPYSRTVARTLLLRRQVMGSQG